MSFGLLSVHNGKKYYKKLQSNTATLKMSSVTKLGLLVFKCNQTTVRKWHLSFQGFLKFVMLWILESGASAGGL